MKPSKKLSFLIAAVAGAVLPLALAPFDFWPLAILSPLALLWVLQPANLTPKLASLLSFIFGLGFFGVGVSWVFVSVHVFGNTDIPAATLVTTLFVVVLALFIGAQGYCLKKWFRGSPMAFCLLGFPSAWVLFEWLRSWLFTGFPWAYLGYTQLNSPLAGFAPVASVYAVSWMVLLTSGALLCLLQEQKNIKISAVFLIVIIWGTGAGLKHYEFTKLNSKEYTASLVQGNVDPMHKFAQQDPIGATKAIYGALTEPYWNSDLILWGEGAIPLPLPYSQEYIDELQASAKKHHATLITGIQVSNEKDIHYNSLIAVGEGNGIYHKYHLLPYGDYLPFERWLRGLINFFDLPMSSFTPGQKNQPLITAGTLKLDPLICYEIAYPEQVRETLRNADAIITLSEDGWFGASWGPHQHQQIAQMRALETGRYVLRVTTSGITSIIDPKGKIAATLPQFKAMVLNGKFQSATGETPWVKIGLWPLLILLAGCFFLPRFKRSRP